MKFAALLLLGIMMSRAQGRCNLISFLWDINDVCHMRLLRYYVTFDGVLTRQDIHNTLNAVCSEVTEERLLCASQWTSACDNRDTLLSYAAVNGICTDDHPSQYAQQLLTSIPPRVNATCMWGRVAAAIGACVELIAWRAAFGYNRSMTEADIFQHHQTQMNNGLLCMYSSGESIMARCVGGEEVEEVEGLKAAYLLALLAYAPPGFIYNITYVTDVTDRH
ncbi:uncharacterized protein LOC124285393 [Haliotis rubra]|uniref:uncharacterized protein LOC124285393 n=1 Tax=Haliotis rubra TaxID=36100 RepID=UPI001EE5C838|nr:uncharacterized protein LOC124285393 [Haliotis rubra]